MKSRLIEHFAFAVMLTVVVCFLVAFEYGAVYGCIYILARIIGAADLIQQSDRLFLFVIMLLVDAVIVALARKSKIEINHTQEDDE